VTEVITSGSPALRSPQHVSQGERIRLRAGRFDTGNEVGIKNPHPTATNSGHIAVVVPSRQEDGSLYDATNRKWKMKVPFIAQAGDEVKDYMPLGDGFGPAKKAGMEIYVLAP
jgi:hypothetical protein